MPGSSSRRALGMGRPWASLIVCAAIAVCSGLLVAGISQPILYTQQMIFWKQTYTVWTGILDLWKMGERLLASVVFLFSILFPFTKLAVLIFVWFVKLSEQQRAKFLKWLGALGKWSMLDVFMVAILIVLIKVGSLARIEPRPGVYFFGAAILCSMMVTALVERVARSSESQ